MRGLLSQGGAGRAKETGKKYTNKEAIRIKRLYQTHGGKGCGERARLVRGGEGSAPQAEERNALNNLLGAYCWDLERE